MRWLRFVESLEKCFSEAVVAGEYALAERLGAIVGVIRYGEIVGFRLGVQDLFDELEEAELDRARRGRARTIDLRTARAVAAWFGELVDEPWERWSGEDCREVPIPYGVAAPLALPCG